MTVDAFDRLPEGAEEVFGAGATGEAAYGLLAVDVPAVSWTAALETARDVLGCTFFDWLSAVDEPGTGLRVCAYVVALGGLAGPRGAAGSVRGLLLRTTVPYDNPALPTATGIYPGAAWHERETHEMFGVDFPGHPHLAPLLLPEEFEGHPLRKDFVLAARVAKAWPGAKEPGEPQEGGAKRRQMLPPGVPDPNEWGPLKGQLPPAPARPARTPRTAAAPGERPPRRARSVSEGSASQQAAKASPGAAAPAAPRKRTSDAPWQQPLPGEPPAERRAPGREETDEGPGRTQPGALPADTGQSPDAERPPDAGRSDDGGRSERPDDDGRSAGPGRSDDGGRSGETERPGRSADAGRPEGPGNPERPEGGD